MDRLARNPFPAIAMVVAFSGFIVPACRASLNKPASGVHAADCIVRLHGKGGTGSPTTVADGVAEVNPTGNADGWGGRQWLYFPDERYAEALESVTREVDEVGCERVVVDGFSNGAAFAASLLCHGETMAGRLVGVVIDDPVTDQATANCARSLQVEAALYWTGGLEADAPQGTKCSTIDWTCEGGVIVGIETYASRLGLAVLPSPFTTHKRYRDAPELTQWLLSG